MEVRPKRGRAVAAAANRLTRRSRIDALVCAAQIRASVRARGVENAGFCPQNSPTWGGLLLAANGRSGAQ